MAEIEQVDAAELAELERMATERDGAESWEPPAALRGPPPAGARTASAPGVISTNVSEEHVLSMTPIYTVGPDGKVKPYVEAAALDARLVRLEHMVRHTMNLVIVLAEILRVDPAEVTHVDRVNREAETRVKGAP